jgi:hypothetical protein
MAKGVGTDKSIKPSMLGLNSALEPEVFALHIAQETS